jgi:hypothetical protein
MHAAGAQHYMLPPILRAYQNYGQYDYFAHLLIA